jgi:hypothetical protein
VADIWRVARSSLVMEMARRLSDLAEVPVGWSPALVQVGGSMADVLAANGITYLAPADARASTLEHIPPDDLAAILRERHRLIRHGGGMSMLIDYSDHWSHFDHSITEYNFLQFTESRWRHLNPALNYQSRLRHSDSLALFEDAGFELVRVTTNGNDEAGLRALDRCRVARLRGLQPRGSGCYRGSHRGPQATLALRTPGR